MEFETDRQITIQWIVTALDNGKNKQSHLCCDGSDCEVPWPICYLQSITKLSFLGCLYVCMFARDGTASFECLK